MNLVRLGMIVALGVVAWYALSVYAALPPDQIGVQSQQMTANVTYVYTCPAITNQYSGQGAIWVALAAIGGALSVSAVDLWRRVY